jgi:hypothetical protein
MLSAQGRQSMVIGITAMIAASFIAGCCAGPFGADREGGCSACAEPAADSDCAESDAGDDSDGSVAGASGG